MIKNEKNVYMGDRSGAYVVFYIVLSILLVFGASVFWIVWQYMRG